MQSFGTEWADVLSFMSDRLADNFLESLYRMQLETLGALKYLMQVCNQITSSRGTSYNHENLEGMVQRVAEQKSEESHTNAEHRMEEKPVSGAPA